MTNIFLKLKNMNHQLSNALSMMLIRRLDIFLHFETYVFENPQKVASCPLPYIAQSTQQGGLGQGLQIFRTFFSI